MIIEPQEIVEAKYDTLDSKPTSLFPNRKIIYILF